MRPSLNMKAIGARLEGLVTVSPRTSSSPGIGETGNCSSARELAAAASTTTIPHVIEKRTYRTKLPREFIAVSFYLSVPELNQMLKTDNAGTALAAAAAPA